MGCRYCETDLIENQEHLETCTGFTHEQRGLDVTEEMVKQIFWRRMAPKLKKIDDEDKYIALKEKLRLKKADKLQKKKNLRQKLQQRLLRQPKIQSYWIN